MDTRDRPGAAQVSYVAQECVAPLSATASASTSVPQQLLHPLMALYFGGARFDASAGRYVVARSAEAGMA